MALGLRHALDPVFPPSFPYISFFPAVIFTAYFVGLLPAVVCIILCAGAARYYFMFPIHSFGLTPSSAFALLFFVAIAGFLAALIDHMQRVTEQLKREQAHTLALNEQHVVMFQELQHRVANNMQFVASLLHLQERKLQLDPSSGARALADAQARVKLMAAVHRRLYDPSIADRPIGDYFKQVVDDCARR